MACVNNISFEFQEMHLNWSFYRAKMVWIIGLSNEQIWHTFKYVTSLHAS